MTNQDFAKLVNKYEKLVYTVCFQFVRNHHTAQDLAQETFVSAYKNLNSCPEDFLKPWLCRIATNKAKDHLKSAYNRKMQLPGEGGLPEGGNILFMQNEDPEDFALQKEGIELIAAQINKLKEPYKMVSVMFFMQEKTVEEIASLLGRPSKTVHTQLYRAKTMLQKGLKGELQNAF